MLVLGTGHIERQSFSIVQQSSSYSYAPNKICVTLWDFNIEHIGQNIGIPYDGKYHSLLVSYNKDASTNNLRIVLDGFQEEIGTLNPSAVNTTPSLARVGAYINNNVSSYAMGKLKIGKITIYNEYFESRLPHYDEPTISFVSVYPNGSYSAGDYSCEVSSVHTVQQHHNLLKVGWHLIYKIIQVQIFGRLIRMFIVVVITSV